METERHQPVKLHRRHVSFDRRAFTVLSPRPSNQCRYATNYFHETWHVLSDVSGARMLSQLCWFLAFQRKTGTIVVIDDGLLVTNPFDADPSSPIVITNADLAPVNKTVIRQLKRFLAAKGPSEGTVRTATGGLDRLLAGNASAQMRIEQQASGVWWNDHQRRCWTDRVNGVVVLAAPPPVLEWWALSLNQLGSHWYRGSDYTELDHPASRNRDGEIQIFENFTQMVSQAAATRQQLFPDAAHRELLEDERHAVWAASASAATRL
jgi:hypothetical protein